MKNARNLVFLTLALALFSHAVLAEQVFDYVRNPTPASILNFQGLSNDVISTTTQPKTGHFFLQTSLKDTMCATRNVTLAGVITVIPNMNVKGYQSCYNVSPTITVNVAIDNPDYGLTQFAKIGDYDVPTNHISVVPYQFNAWQTLDTNSKNPQTMFNRIIVAFDRNPSLQYLDSNKKGDIGGWFIDEMTFFGMYEYKINDRKGVCSDEVLRALNAPSTYYKNPSKLTVSGFGAITAANCKSLMFPAGVDRVNGLFGEHPEVFNSLFYNSQFAYLGYPFTIKDIQVKCYKNGTLIGYDYLDSPSRKNAQGELTSGKNYAIINAQTQPYPWTTLRDGRGLTSPGHLELLKKDFSLTCPAGTNYYTASVVISKNAMYRHISPVDATWKWQDIFNTASGSKLDPFFSSAGANDTIIYLTQTGTITPPQAALIPPNATYSPSQNPDKNKINESSSNAYGKSTAVTYGRKPITYSGGDPPCVDCQQNITDGYGAGLNGSNSGAGIIRGGSFITTGVDDSAVSGLVEQGKGDNRIQQKASFMQKLVELGKLVLTTIIVFVSLFSLFGILFLFFLFFSIPRKMREAMTLLFKAGTRK